VRRQVLVLGSIGVLALLEIGALFFLRHRRRQRTAGYGEKQSDARPGPFTDHKVGGGVGAIPSSGRGSNGMNGTNGLGVVPAAGFHYDERTRGYVPGTQNLQSAGTGVLANHPPPGESFGAIPTTPHSANSDEVRKENYLGADGVGAVNGGGGAPIRENYPETQRAEMEGSTRSMSGVHELP
jgi:hypothetical protein